MRRAVDEIKDRDIEVPWSVARYLGKRISIMGEQACLTEQGDYGRLAELRGVLEWYVDQFGGRVTWEQKGKKNARKD